MKPGIPELSSPCSTPPYIHACTGTYGYLYVCIHGQNRSLVRLTEKGLVCRRRGSSFTRQICFAYFVIPSPLLWKLWASLGRCVTVQEPSSIVRPTLHRDIDAVPFAVLFGRLHLPRHEHLRVLGAQGFWTQAAGLFGLIMAALRFYEHRPGFPELAIWD